MDNNNNNDKNTTVSSAATETIAPLKFEPLSGNKPATSLVIKRKTVLIIISFLICAATAIFLFTAKAVYIETHPINTEIEIGSLLKLKLADRYLLISGEHELLLKAEGYHSLNPSLSISKEQNQHFTFELKRLPGHLQVQTGEVTDAEIFIDDVSLGQTPSLIRDIEAGEHQLRIVAERYFPFEQQLIIEGLDKEQSFTTELIPAWAEVTLDSDPQGADIFLDGELFGQTPFDAEILEGHHEIGMKLSGFKLWQDEVNVVANESMELTDITLQPVDAVLFLVSDPPRANATADGEYKGLTPLEFALKPGKESTIRLFKQGYKSASRKVSVNSGEEKRLIVKLAPELVKVEFSVMPKDAKLYIDGIVKDKANQILDLSAKPHRIEVRKPGYVSFKTKISPHLGIAEKVNVSLKSERQAKLEKIKPIYTNTAGQTLKLFHPTAFTMGASRREPGRRANETIRKIELKRPFYLGTHEVSNEQYRKYAASHVSGAVQGNNLNGEKQPAVKLSWEQAAAYCNWLSKAESLEPFYKEANKKISGINPSANGYRLPTEAEWAWAARVTGKNSLLKYPWGEQLPPTEKSGNYADTSSAGFLGRIIGNYNDGHMVSAPIGSFPANQRGLFDMGGNVAEWINDFYDIQLGATDKAEIDPLGPDTGKFHVIRGSSWAHGTVTELRLSYRDYNAKQRDDVGFRIARYLE
jgi:formylglycine-generating enzyme required for sulfatase activity